MDEEIVYFSYQDAIDTVKVEGPAYEKSLSLSLSLSLMIFQYVFTQSLHYKHNVTQDQFLNGVKLV